MRFIIEDEQPTKVWVEGLSVAQLTALRSSLSYVDQKLVYQANRFKQTGGWYRTKFGEEAFRAKIDEMKAEAQKTLLFQEDGQHWTYAGAFCTIERLFPGVRIENKVKYPELLGYKFVNQPHQLRDYQSQMVEALLKQKHACVSSATGTGKSRTLMEVVARIGQKTLIMTPSTSISDQLYQDFVKTFGAAKVGRFFGSKKESSKSIVIGNAQSLTRVERGSKHWCELLKTKVFVSDESHLTAADTLASVCFGLMAKVPYRFFFSATQMRNDGLGVLLEGIIGPEVYNFPLREAVQAGYLAPPVFNMMKVKSDFVPHPKSDPNDVTRECLYYNPNVVKQVAALVNAAVARKQPTLVLIEEVEQFTKLLPYLECTPLFAHGTLNEENRVKVPEEYWDSDPNELVAKFNDLKAPLLVGTSCVSTGTDIRPVQFLVYWQGGKSEIQVKQAVGRGTRLYPGKNKCNIIDFDVYNVETLHRHAKARREIYEDLLGPVKDIEPRHENC